jgi:hypothetical protein
MGGAFGPPTSFTATSSRSYFVWGRGYRPRAQNKMSQLKRTHLSVSGDRGSSERRVGEPPLPLPNLAVAHEQTVAGQAAAREERRSRLQRRAQPVIAGRRKCSWRLIL